MPASTSESSGRLGRLRREGQPRLRLPAAIWPSSSTAARSSRSWAGPFGSSRAPPRAPLHAHRPADRAREQRGLARRRRRRRSGRRSPRRPGRSRGRARARSPSIRAHPPEAVRVLGRAPDRGAVGAHVGHAARGADRAVGLDGPPVRGRRGSASPGRAPRARTGRRAWRSPGRGRPARAHRLGLASGGRAAPSPRTTWPGARAPRAPRPTRARRRRRGSSGSGRRAPRRSPRSTTRRPTGGSRPARADGSRGRGACRAA